MSEYVLREQLSVNLNNFAINFNNLVAAKGEKERIRKKCVSFLFFCQ